MSKLFCAAGSKYFDVSLTSDKGYQKKLYNGGKPLSSKHKASFPDRLNATPLAELFVKHIAPGKVRTVMTSFAIPVSAKEDSQVLSKALSEQFRLIINSDSDEVDDIVASEYQRLLSESAESSIMDSPRVPLYPNDSAWVLGFIPQRTYKAKCYEVFQHTWHIRNNGQQTWRDRKLHFINAGTARPRADSNHIDVPITAPGEEIKIAANFDARGFEGAFQCVWVMCDSDNNDCFPNDRDLFSITITVEFNP